MVYGGNGYRIPRSDAAAGTYRTWVPRCAYFLWYFWFFAPRLQTKIFRHIHTILLYLWLQRVARWKHTWCACAVFFDFLSSTYIHTRKTERSTFWILIDFLNNVLFILLFFFFFSWNNPMLRSSTLKEVPGSKSESSKSCRMVLSNCLVPQPTSTRLPNYLIICDN